MNATSGCLELRNTRFTGREDLRKGADEVGRGEWNPSAYYEQHSIQVQLGQEAIKNILSFLKPSSSLQECWTCSVFVFSIYLSFLKVAAKMFSAVVSNKLVTNYSQRSSYFKGLE